MIKTLPSVCTLRRLLHYDSETGDLTWRLKKRGVSTKLNSSGYQMLCIRSTTYLAHRIAWKIFYGVDPLDIDHINRDTTDNRIKNLRDITHGENMTNRVLHKNNTSGFPGVFWLKNRNKWMAQININGKQTYIGCYPCKCCAHFAREAAHKKISDAIVSKAPAPLKSQASKESQDALTVHELAKVLRFHPASLRGLVKAGVFTKIEGINAFSINSIIQSLLEVYMGQQYQIPTTLPKDWLKAADVAQLLDMAPGSILRYCRNKQIPHFRLAPHTIRFRESDIKRWIELGK